jgi:phospholipase/carboxylesterase
MFHAVFQSRFAMELDLPLPHRLALPEGPRPWPAVVLVHGWRGNENVMWTFASVAPAGVALFSPRGSLAADPDGYGWFSEQPEDSEVLAGVQALEAFILALPRHYPIDRKRITLIGFSQGAAVSAALWLRNPGIAQRVALLAGFLPRPARAWGGRRQLAGRTAFIAHGLHDTTISVDQARTTRDHLAAVGADITYGEYLVGHKMNSQALRDLAGWLGAEPDLPVNAS